MSSLDLRALLAALHAAEARFVLIGGVAVAAHGYVRATEDLDIVPDPSAENLRRLGNALVRMGATLPLADGRDFVPRDGPLNMFSGHPASPDSMSWTARRWTRICWGARAGLLSRSPQAHEGSAREQPGPGRPRSAPDGRVSFGLSSPAPGR